MKKKPLKKLTLDRETLRSLEESRLAPIRGAALTWETCWVSVCLECRVTMDCDPQ